MEFFFVYFSCKYFSNHIWLKSKFLHIVSDLCSSLGAEPDQGIKINSLFPLLFFSVEAQMNMCKRQFKKLILKIIGSICLGVFPYRVPIKCVIKQLLYWDWISFICQCLWVTHLLWEDSVERKDYQRYWIFKKTPKELE